LYVFSRFTAHYGGGSGLARDLGNDLIARELRIKIETSRERNVQRAYTVLRKTFSNYQIINTNSAVQIIASIVGTSSRAYSVLVLQLQTITTTKKKNH